MSERNGGNSRLDRIEKIIERTERASLEAHARHEREMRQIREEGRKTQVALRRWAQLGVNEARNQRKRSREFDENITRLSAAQLVSEEKLQRLEAAQLVTAEMFQQFISSLRRGGNGNGKGERKRWSSEASPNSTWKLRELSGAGLQFCPTQPEGSAKFHDFWNPAVSTRHARARTPRRSTSF
jgi:hypothetical protein